MTKRLDALVDKAGMELAMGRPALALVDETLVEVAKLPYGGRSGKREEIEIEILEKLVRSKQRPVVARAKQVWKALVLAWTAAGPVAGQQFWWQLARAQAALGTRLPAKERAAIRRAWATGRLCNVYEAKAGTSKKQPPKRPNDAQDQACVEIGLGAFDRARACATVAAKKWPLEAELFEPVILHAEGKPAEALAAVRRIAKSHEGEARYVHWETLLALLVLLDEPDAALAKRCLARWKQSEAGLSAIYEG